MTPTEQDWDLHLVRAWYADKYMTMHELAKAFHCYWGVWPSQMGLKRYSNSGIAVWKLVEEMPTLHKVLQKYPRDRAEEIAMKLQGSNIKPKNTSIKEPRSKYYGMTEARKQNKRSAAAAEVARMYNRGEQWNVCK